MFSDYGRLIRLLLVLIAMGTWISSPQMAQDRTLRTANQAADSSSPVPSSWRQGREPALQQQAQENRETRAQPSPVPSLLVQKAPLSAVARCATSALEEKGWSVLPFENEKRQLLAFRVIGADELPRVADTQQPQGGSDRAQARANLNLNFSPAKDGRTRIDVRLRIVGEGATSLPVLRPSNWTALPSTGALESDVLAALQVHCGPARNLPSADHGTSRRRKN